MPERRGGKICLKQEFCPGDPRMASVRCQGSRAEEVPAPKPLPVPHTDPICAREPAVGTARAVSNQPVLDTCWALQAPSARGQGFGSFVHLSQEFLRVQMPQVQQHLSKPRSMQLFFYFFSLQAFLESFSLPQPSTPQSNILGMRRSSVPHPWSCQSNGKSPEERFDVAAWS